MNEKYELIGGTTDIVADKSGSDCEITIKQTAAPGEYSLQIRGTAKYVMYHDVNAVTQTFKIKVVTIASDEYLELAVTPNVPSDLTLNVPQGVTQCKPG